MMSINHDIIVLSKKWILIILVSACVLEAFIFFSGENLYGCFALVYGWLLVSKFVFTRNNIQNYPLPTITVSMLGFCYYFLPLVVTLIERKPLSFNFQVPYLTYSNQMISITVIVVAYRCAIKFYTPNCMLNRLWNKIGYMTVPSEKQIWILGFIGLFALLSIMSGMGEEREYQATGNFGGIVINVLSKFSIAPICLYFKHLYGEETTVNSRRFVKYYIVILMILGIASTRRGMVLNPLVSIAFIYLFLLLYNNRKVFTTRNSIIVIVSVYLFTGPFADMAMAMILNRHFGGNATQTAEAVWKLYNDKEKLRTMYGIFTATLDNGGDNREGWSEYYVDNIFLDRFCNLRTIDGTLYNAQRAGVGCNEGTKYYENYWINELPGFAVNALGLKKDFQGTATDHMVISNFIGDRYNVRGFKVGGETGIGLWMFGYSYYLIAFLTYIVVFYFLCSFVNIRDGALLIPLPILVTFRPYWMFFLNANGIFTSMNFTFARNNLNTILIYCVLVFIIKLLILQKRHA